MVTVQLNSTSVGNARIRTAANNSAAGVVLHAGADEAFSGKKILISEVTGRGGISNPVPPWRHNVSSGGTVSSALRKLGRVQTYITPSEITPSDSQVGITETISAAAEKLAKSVHAYKSVSLAKEIIRAELGTNLTALEIDVKEDPDDDGYTTICFNVCFQGSVDEALALDQRVQKALIERIPAKQRVYLAVNYNFQSAE
jgi:hypothetical protein